MTTLFTVAGDKFFEYRPLADRLRPLELSKIVGQPHLLNDEGALTRLINSGVLRSLIFWGPPGTGKTTTARILSQKTNYFFEVISALSSGVADLKKIFEAARLRREAGQPTLLFVDEIHRFNRAQQDAFLPVMEDGTITLIGATTENPSFALNTALLSRARVMVFNRLDSDALHHLLQQAEDMLETPLPLDPVARDMLVGMADGDGRSLLTLVEDILRGHDATDVLDAERLQMLIQRRAPVYDKAQDGHYNLISALHKSVRGSDPDAALYYLCRMFDAGEDPLFLARRLVRMAVEDIGLADPHALVQANAAKEAYALLGSPEGELALVQACVYLASAPKSNGIYTAYKMARDAARHYGSLPPPKHILNAPTSLMKEQGYNAGYVYDHDAPNAFSGQEYFPEAMPRKQFYDPPERGFEREIRKRLDYWERLRQERKKT